MNEAEYQTYKERVVEELDVRSNELEVEKLELEVADLQRQAHVVETAAELNGHFTFVDDVHTSTVHRLIAKLDAYTRQNPGADVHIMLNCAGGSVTDGFALIDFLRLMQRRGHKVVITGYGLVASMGASILMAASERVITPRCWIGLHEVSSGNSGSLTVQEDQLKFTRALQKQAVDLLCERSKLTARSLATRIKRRDVFVDAKEALRLGLVDRVEDVG